ncbi:hypothetical protein C8F04DRAFT_1190598 [Mycena alexandri]|uniref:Uncharacterized protein n=1 Tax=Mycena alexandri TaxID=1745969 RepID=A0AAD6SF60_9AGAR|nr:hypothetical protein C8F04DRAFT_1190598 [Mycena alexandri]
MENYDTKEAAMKTEGKSGDEYTITAVDVDVRPDGVPPAWKAVLKGSQGRQEAIFTMIGAIINKDLPPANSANISRHRLNMATQRVTLVGFGSAAFEQGIQKLFDVSDKVNRQFAEDSVALWAVNKGEHGLMVESGCRYFTMGHSIPEDAKVAFSNKVDLENVLGKFLSNSISHCEDNDVEYLELKNSKVIRKAPVGFRVGDIVQVGVSICVFKCSKMGETPRFTCKLVLRSVTLLDISITKQAQMLRLERLKSDTRAVLPAQAFKRNCAYVDSDSDDEGLPTTRQRMGELTIGDVEMNGSKSG